ncbi:hypothetical protein VMCG_10792 [Cytospora schulzeri]|uniref:Uncharacterized protein n=1 Tax=Cytospora schulzeri TaxID=448051 RepID=A0A423VAB2_9PEZI|nr:hypothetical protein VMCG_10792 [Valsa malicola]
MPPPPMRAPGHGHGYGHGNGQGAKIQGKAMTGTGAQIRILGVLANRLIPKPRGSGTQAPRLIWWPEHIRIFQRFLAANQHSPDSLRALSAGNSGSNEDICMRELAEELGIRTRQLQHAQWLGIKDKMLSSLQYRLSQLILEGLVEETWDVRNDRPAWTWDSQITREIIAADWTGHVGKPAMTGDEDEDDENEDSTSRHMDNEASGYSVQHDEEDIPSVMSDIGLNDGLQYESYVQGDMARSEYGQNPHSSNDDMNNDMNSDMKSDDDDDDDDDRAGIAIVFPFKQTRHWTIRLALVKAVFSTERYSRNPDIAFKTIDV